MQLDTKDVSLDEEKKDFKPVFKSRKDRSTLSTNEATCGRRKKKGMLVGKSDSSKEVPTTSDADIEMEGEANNWTIHNPHLEAG